MTGPEYVFGYGSLVETADQAGHAVVGKVAHALDYCRNWSVAMENSRDIPGYKYYLDAKDGTRPDVVVVFLNIVRCNGARVNGLVREVAEAELIELDSRERNYSRTDISAHIAPAIEGTVWAYMGTSDAVERFRKGLSEQRAVIGREYLEGVKRQFAALGDQALREYEDLTEVAPCPLRDLKRIESN